ncbi:MAG: DUF3500 domain-containing protein [Pirellulales bacterium]
MKRHQGRLFVFACVSVAVLVTTSFSWSYLQQSSPGAAMSEAAREFLAALTGSQQQKAQMEYGMPQRVDWHFIPKDQRKGVQIKEMTELQREAAHQLLASALSEIGYTKAKTIMQLEAVLNELQQGRGGPIRDTERYYFTIFGDPNDQGRWGLSVEGHHLSLNFVVEDNQVISSSPQVYATNPAVVKEDYSAQGIEKGTRVLAKEETLAFELVNSLTGEQQSTAVIAQEAPREIRAAGEPQPPTDAPEGLPAGQMTDQQKQLLNELIAVYARNMPQAVAEKRMNEIDEAGRDSIHFAWAGAKREGVGHYYRVQGPTFLIEFVNTQPDSAGNPANHIHSIWRDMRGDFAVAIGQ